jgi:hypothetical protein
MFTSRRITTMGGDIFRDEYSISFDGTNDYVKIPHSSDLNFSGGDFSLTCWAKIPNGTTSEKLLDKWLVHDGEGGWFMYVSGSGTLRVRMEDGSGTNNATDDGAGDYIVFSGSTSIDTDKWVFLTVTYDADGDITLYIDAVNDTSNSNASALGAIDTSYDLYIGANQTNNENFDGKISEVAIYNTVLSASQVKTLYNGREPYNHKEGIASGNLKAWYRMGDGVIDRIGLRNHGATGGIADMSNYSLGADVLGGKGDFSDPSYWDITTDESIVEDGVGKFLGAGSYAHIRKTGVLTANKVYLLKITCTANAGAVVNLNFASASSYPRLVESGETGTFTICFEAGTTDVVLYASLYASAVTIDNVTIQEVGGNPGAIINMSPDHFEGDTP